MTKRSTKSALLLSALAMLMCVAMLVGTTFAWFTDSVSSAGNVIKSGNLDLDVQYTLDGETWADLSGANDLFQKGLWEPGHTEVIALRIENKGTLALKYVANMNIKSETIGKSQAGDDIVLSDILQVATVVQEANIVGDILLSMVFGGSKNTDTGSFTSFKDASVLQGSQELLPGSAHYAIVTVTMPNSVGNEANHDGINVPSIEFGINVFATQFTYESDSFGNGYDSDADYEIGWDGTYPTERPDSLVIDEANDTLYVGDEYALAYLDTLINDDSFRDRYNNPICANIVLTADLNMGNQPFDPITLTNFASFDGGNHTIKNLKVVEPTATGVGLFSSIGNGKNGVTTVSNLIISGAYVEGRDGVGVLVGMNNCATIENVHVKNATVIGETNVGGIDGRSYGSVSYSSVKNTSIEGTKRVGGITGFANSNNNTHLVYVSNVVDKVTLTGGRIGGFIGQSAAGNAGITISNSVVKNSTITADFEASSYSANDYIGNNTPANGSATVLENCTAENNTLINN